MDKQTPDTTPLEFVFFGTPRFAVIVLEELKAAGYVPSLIVTSPDQPKGRKLILTPSEVRVWANEHGIPVLTPSSLRDDQFLSELKRYSSPLFIVAAYGKLIPKTVLDMPEYGILNVHPSLLPKFRGASPIESTICSEENETGVTIMKIDEEMDHGDIVAQKECAIPNWPPKGSVLTELLAHEGGKLLAATISSWTKERRSTPQNEQMATFTKKITKEDGLIDLEGDATVNLKKIRAYDEWPGAYFFAERNGKKIRVRIIDAKLEGEKLLIERVVPEGKKEMPYADFLRGQH